MLQISAKICASAGRSARAGRFEDPSSCTDEHPILAFEQSLAVFWLRLLDGVAQMGATPRPCVVRVTAMTWHEVQ